MKVRKPKWLMALIAVGLALTGLPAFAQTQTETAPSVAHVSLIQGNVSMQRGASGEWMAVTVNTPLFAGDSIATGPGSRAEIQLDYANVLRLAQNSEAKIADLSKSRIQLQVPQGMADLVVFQGNQTSSELDTPNVAIEPLQAGTYRINVDSNSLSLVTVRSGQAQISTPQGSTTVAEGQQITVQGVDNPQYQVASARPMDSWDQWNSDRNRTYEDAQNYNHVNRYYAGAQDLGGYGRWVYVPNYDWCWTPYVNAGWAPYSYGRWVWEPFYGWTWVSYQPWGWAPFHYGRWFVYGSSWYWWPGYVTPYYYPTWGPAWVSFIGFGYGHYRFSFGFGYGFRRIGWCPLGPRDRFHPWWGRGHSFNVVNYHDHFGRGYDGRRGYRGSNLAAAFSNPHVRRGITVVPADRFGRGPVIRNHQVVSTVMLRNSDLVHGTLPVVPGRASLRVSNRAAVVPAVARSRASNTHFFTRRPVTSFNHERSFHTQVTSIRRMVEMHNARAVGANRGNAQAPADRGFRFSRQVGGQQRAAQNNRQTSRRFGPSVPAGNARGQQARGFEAQTRGNNGRRAAPIVRETPRNGRVQHSNQGNFRRFGTGTSGVESRRNAGRRGAAPVYRQAPQRRQTSSPRGNPAARGQQNGRGTFRRFTPQPGPQSAPRNQGRSFNNSRAAPRRDNGNGNRWTPFRPQRQSNQQRDGRFYNRQPRVQRQTQPGYQRQQNFSRQYSRPPLRLNKPIVTERRRSSQAPRARQENRGSFHRSAPRPSHGNRGGHHRR